MSTRLVTDLCPRCGKKIAIVKTERNTLYQCLACGFVDLIIPKIGGLKGTHDYLADWVRKDPDTVEHILTVALSSVTGKPLNLMLRGKSSVGKSWPLEKVMGLFPNATILSGATPKNFFYENGSLVGEDGEPIDERLRELSIDAAGLEGSERTAVEQERKLLLSTSRVLLDFRDRIFAVLDTVPQELWDTLKAALSHDSYEMEYRTVVEGRQRVVLIRGWPCVIYATAANEEKRRGWDQIRNRFVITTPDDSPEKFEAGNRLTSDLYGLPSVALQVLYPKKKFDQAKEEIANALSLIKRLREETQTADDDPTANIIFNPLRRWLDSLFPHNVGDDMRNYRYLHAYINISALMNADERLRLKVDGRTVAVVAAWIDIERAIGLVGKDLTPLAADKIGFYKTWVEPMWAERVKQNVPDGKLKSDAITPAFTVADVVNYARQRGRPLSRASVRDTYLDLFVDVGLLKEDNPDRRQNQAIEYRPLLEGNELGQFIEGFKIPRQPEPEIVKEAISELGGILAGKALTWEIDGQTVNFGDGGALSALFRHARNEPLSPSGISNRLGNDESHTESANPEDSQP